MLSPRVEVVPQTSPEFPDSLRDLEHVPDPLYAIGDLTLLEKPIVAIVGTREPTAYGLRVARSISTALAECGVVIVSGMARGIDAAAHRAAIECGGSTIAVLGTGIDVPYPVGHTELHRVIGERGLVLSENPSGSPAYKGAFPRRNRIIAALGRFTIVVEGGYKSGAINTASHVIALGKPLAAVPGPIDSPQSHGPNQLLRDGAAVISHVHDVLALAGVSAPRQTQPIQLSEIEARVWSAIGGETIGPDIIAHRAGLSARECMASITALELGGMVESLLTGEVRRR